MIQLSLDQSSAPPLAEPVSNLTRLMTPERAELTAVVIRAQAGDQDAQSDLVRRYQRRIAGHVRVIIRQPEAIEDVTQTVFIKMVRRLGRLREPSLFECWLFTLSRNTCVDFIRRRRRRPMALASEEELLAIADPSAGSAGTTHEIMDEFDAALTRLTPVDRKLMGLYVQGNSYRAMAASEGLTPGAVKARLHRMRPMLRACLGAAEPGAREAPGWRALPSSRCAA
jgi:RNA polymerase sigma-70 factor (ECF subfamily)